MVDEAREEKVFREKRIALLRDLLRVSRKHKEYFSMVGSRDTTASTIETLKTQMRTARAVRQYTVATFRSRERDAVTRLLTEIFSKTVKSEGVPYVRVGFGKNKTASKTADIKNAFNVSVGYMWKRKVYEEIYENCSYEFTNHVILDAEKVRVNHKWIELFDVKAFNVNTKEMESGYVVRTKTPKRNTRFARKAHLAVKLGEDAMIAEMDKQKEL